MRFQIILILEPMEKQWFPQRNIADAPIALFKTFITHLNLSISQFTIENDVKAHKDYPRLSDKAMIEILAKWGIKAASYKANLEQLPQIPSLSFLFIEDLVNGDTKMVSMVLYYSIWKGNIIEYLHPRKGWVLEDQNEFEKKWLKVALSITDLENPDGEPDFVEKEESYNKEKFENPELKNIQLRDNFLTDSECEYIINLSQPISKPSGLGVASEDSIIDYGRTSRSSEFHIYPNDEVLNGIRKKASEILKVPESHFEFFQCVRYEPGQEYQNHYDTFDETNERGKKEIEESGQRKYTMLAYLNDDFEGGGTYFPNVDILVTPKKGRVVIFNNLDENGQVIKAAYHAGLPVTKGCKYAINIWVRNKPIKNR